MGFFDALLLETQDAAKREEDALANWKAYMSTFDEKIRICNGNFDIVRLKELVRLGVTDARAVGRDDDAITADLLQMRRDTARDGLSKTKIQLDHADTQHNYLRRLLEHLYLILTTEDYLLRQNTGAVRTKFQEQLALEHEVIVQVNAIPDSLKLFKEFAQGVHEMEAVDERVKAAFRLIDPSFRDFLSEEKVPVNIPQMQELIGRLLAGIQAAAKAAVDTREIAKFHPDVDFEFVNRPMFERYVRDVLASMGKTKVSDRLVAAIVHRFRESYNQR